MEPNTAIWAIAAAATAGVVLRPFGWPEAVWAVAGAALVVAFGLLPPAAAVQAVARGDDVYAFLIGMMLLSETARLAGVFDWVAAAVVRAARGSPARLFALVYAAGVVVTVFLSNDATAVVLTPAVFAAARRAEAEPLPLLFVCAFVANAASFVLPIANPANLVLYGADLPALGAWLARFALPSLAAIGITFVGLRLVEGRRLGDRCAAAVESPPLTVGGRLALGGIVATVAVLTTVSALGVPLGLPTLLAGAATSVAVAITGRRGIASEMLAGVSWGVLPLVAGLFVLVAAVDATGVAGILAGWLVRGAQVSVAGTAAVAGAALAFGCNLINNLPAGLLAATAVAKAAPPARIVDALLIGVDLGPNLSVTGSLATILWLTALRREGQAVGFWRFFRVGVVVMPPALAAALAVRLALG